MQKGYWRLWFGGLCMGLVVSAAFDIATQSPFAASIMGFLATVGIIQFGSAYLPDEEH